MTESTDQSPEQTPTPDQEISPADESAVQAAVDRALADFQAAGTLEELKTARLAHTGEKLSLIHI